MNNEANDGATLKDNVIRARLAYLAAQVQVAQATPAEPVPAPEHLDAEGRPTDAFFDSPAWMAFDDASEDAAELYRTTELFRAVGAAEDALIDWSFDVMKAGAQTSFAFRRIAATLDRGRRSFSTRAKLADLALKCDGVPQ